MRDNRLSDLVFIAMAMFFTINLLFILILGFKESEKRIDYPPIHQVVYIQQSESNIPPINIKVYPQTNQFESKSLGVSNSTPLLPTPSNIPNPIPTNYKKEKPILSPSTKPTTIPKPTVTPIKRYYFATPMPSVFKNVYCRKGW